MHDTCSPFRLSLLFLLTAFSAQSAFAASVVRGPYLQQVTQTSITVRWRTDTATSNAVVRYDTSCCVLNQTSPAGPAGTEHVVEVSGLTPGTPYYYSVGDSSQTLEGGTTDYYFSTAPADGAAGDTRIWVIGDSGKVGENPINVRNAYTGYVGSDPADIWLMLGDNAYNSGTDSEYQVSVFGTYPDILRNTPLWSTLGNHDGYSADSDTQTGPYYNIFTLPTAAEAGGVASGTEAYYSFDYSDIHFVVLDSYDTDRSVNGAMMTWLVNDLAANGKKWLIAFWHHPPYSKGTHDTDVWPGEQESFEMRANALPILESYGVDMVLSGHSHVYERSYFIDGHYGVSGSFDPPTMLVDGGNGKEGGDGAYYRTVIGGPNRGTVYAVAGSSSRLDPTYTGDLDHPVMFVGLEELGSMVLDISGDRLDAIFIDDAGAQRDYFTIVKDFDGDGYPDDSDVFPFDGSEWSDNDVDGVGDNADMDDDNDGMPDTFETDNGLDPNDPGDAGLDPDVDGLNNLQEYLKNPGLDPNDPDTDDDGIGDSLDDNPVDSDNGCSDGNLFDRTLANDDISGPLTCAARQTITVKPTTTVQSPDGYLKLIAPTVIFESGFTAGDLSVLSADSCPECP